MEIIAPSQTGPPSAAAPRAASPKQPRVYGPLILIICPLTMRIIALSVTLVSLITIRCLYVLTSLRAAEAAPGIWVST